MGKIKDKRRKERTKRRVKRALLFLLAYLIVMALWYLWNLHLHDLDQIHALVKLHHKDTMQITGLRQHVESLQTQNNALQNTVNSLRHAVQVKINGAPITAPTPAPVKVPSVPHVNPIVPIVAGLTAILSGLFKAVVPAL